VSLASAQAAFDRLVTEVVEVTPGSFLILDDATLKRIGFSRQKTRYCRDLATAIRDGILDLDRLERLEDEEARAELSRIKGIGHWTADIYLLMALGRPDIWPNGDLALAKAAQRVKRLDAVPTPAELEGLGEAWRPWRAVAARLLWHHYLSSLGTRDSGT